MRTLALGLLAAAIAASSAQSALTSDLRANLTATPAAAKRVRIGDTEKAVAKLLGTGYARCTDCGPDVVWLYEYRDELGVGVAIAFEHGRVSAVLPLSV